jgi:hypothetical protein
MKYDQHVAQQHFLLLLLLGICDICADQKILFMSETKWYEIQLRPTGLVK